VIIASTLTTNLAILVLAGFIGFVVISKVPNTLHTPLMSGTNAIHGIVLLGGLLLLGLAGLDWLSKLFKAKPKPKDEGADAPKGRDGEEAP
jgi:hypothetical protein